MSMNRKQNASNQNYWQIIKQLGSLLGEAKDIERCRFLASQTYNFHSLCLCRKHVSEAAHLKPHKKLVIVDPVLLYNCEMLKPSSSTMQPHHQFCWHQLRNLTGVQYPDCKNNAALLARCKTQPLLESVTKHRLRLTGHNPRMN